MYKKISFLILIILIFLSGFYTGRYGHIVIKPEEKNSQALFDEVYRLLETNYYQKINNDDLIKGMVDSLKDPYTVFYTPKETEEFKELISGKYVGIGVIISQEEDKNKTVIKEVFKNSPAERAGIIPGDILIEADGESLVGLSLDQVASKVKGLPGTVVNLVIQRNGEKKTFSIKREEIIIPIIDYKTYDEGKIGYIALYSFNELSSAKFNEAFNKLSKEHIKGLIVDLRNNGGGYLDQALEILKNFIKSGPALYIKKGEDLTPLNINGKDFNLPLVVLVNGGTASASEIFAGAIRDYKKGVIIGDKTFGKGIIQKSWDLEGGYSIKITIEEYLTPNKIQINKIGIKPDIEVFYKGDPKKTDEEQLKKAIETIREEIKK